MINSKIKNGYLVITRADGRVTQYKIPRRIHFFYGFMAAALIFLVTHPVVSSLLGQAATELDANKLSQAASLAMNQVQVDAHNAMYVRRPPRDSQLPTYHLQLPNNTLQEMQRSLTFGSTELNHDPGGVKPYHKSILAIDNHTVEAKVCIRGLMHWHHRTEKPSFRIKLKKGNVRTGDRYIELITPEDALVLNNWLPMHLAGNLGLLTDTSRHVRLFINKKYMGVYIRSTRPGEPFALANQRMPGTFFKAEFSDQMWESSASWKTFGQQDPLDLVVIQRFLDTLALPVSASSVEQLATVFDTEEFAKWAALMTVVGSIHTDDQHNHSYFFCANQGKLEAMPWDCNGYGLHTQPNSPVDVQVQPVLRFLSADPRWIHRRNQWIYRLINHSASIEEIEPVIDECLSSMQNDMMADRNLGNLKKFTGTGWNWIPVSVAETDAMRDDLILWIASRNRFLASYVGDARYSIQSTKSTGYAGCQVNVFGSAAVRFTHRITGESGILYPGLSQRKWVHTSHQQQAEIQFQYLRPAVQTYYVNANPTDLEFSNAVTGDSIVEHELPDALTKSDARASTVHKNRFLLQSTSEFFLGPGRVELTEDLIIGSQQQLTVVKGTQLVLSPGVGIYCRGKVHFSGTADHPIQIRGSRDEPWAAIGLTGEQTAGSIFEYVDIQGGSIGQLDHLRFKGMVSVYNCPSITLRHCRFGPNQIGDDAVNLAESNIVVDRCRWFDALADALDLDMCQGIVTDCRWINSGNDGLDLMSSDVTVTDCLISGSGDKGISVGENSRLKAHSISIVNCSVGVEIKDDSVAQFNACLFDRCKVAVHSYQKKWFYSKAGQSALIDCQIRDSLELDLDMKAKSHIVLIRTPIFSQSNTKRIHELQSLPDDWDSIMQPAQYASQQDVR